MKRSSLSMTCLVILGLLTTTSVMAYADGPSSSKSAIQPALTPLDKAVQEIENKEPPPTNTETAEEMENIAPAPMVVETPPPTVAPIEQFEPPAETVEITPPVPETRTVNVQPNTAFFGLSVGMYDPFRSNRPAFNLEYQTGTKIAGFLQPLFGAMATVDGALMAYGGVGVPFRLGERIFVMPSVGLGAYKEGAGFDLGQTLAYRVGTEIAYEFDDKSRFGINAHFITNGDSLKGEDRTGIIALTYTTPVTWFSGGN